MTVNTIHHEASSQVGARLREVREARRLSPEQVANLIKISGSTLEEIEAGNIQGHFKEIFGLLCLYSESSHSIFNGYFGASYLDYSSEKTDLRDSIAFVLDSIRLHKSIQNKPMHLTSIPLARGRSNGQYTNLSGLSEIRKQQSLRKAVPSLLEGRARDVINQHRLYKLPINVYQVAANLGISVSFESFPSDLYMKLRGFCYKEDDFGLIGINKSHPIALQRFTIAHECYHYLYDFNSTRFLCGPDNSTEAFEWNAERFAAELLMPKDSVKRLISNPLNVRYLTVHLVAEHFGVSYEAAAIRLSNFGLVPDAQQACDPSYRQKDKKKTKYLLESQVDRLNAVFGLETGIKDLLEIHTQVKRHYLCGAVITDPSHTVCWRCGLEIEEPKSTKDYCLKSPYRQKASNLSSKLPSLEERQKNANQITPNLSA